MEGLLNPELIFVVAAKLEVLFLKFPIPWVVPGQDWPEDNFHEA